MAQRCTVCEHEQRDEIDALVLAGASYRDVGSRFGLNYASVGRHRQNHMSAAFSSVTAEWEATHPTPLLQRIESLIARVERILTQAEAEGKPSQALAAVKELRGLLELLGKASGELDDRPQVSINILTTPEWLSVRDVILSALAGHPEARTAVAHRLLELEVAA